MKIAITGSAGHVGSYLTPFLQSHGHDIIRILRRMPKSPATYAYWDPETGMLDTANLEGVDAVIHLAGENILFGRWTRRKKAAIKKSRERGTRLIAEALAGLENPPALLISASATGIYGNRGDEILTEDAAPGEGFLADVCRVWEAATEPASQKGIRVVHLRLGLILSPWGGGLSLMLPPFRMGIGGRVGSGQQYMSWITIDDVLGIILHAIHTEELVGAVNAVTPHPVRNREFAQTLGKVLGRPALLPAPAFMIKLVFGSEKAKELFLPSIRATPAKLLATDYLFLYPQLEEALLYLFRQQGE